MGPQAANISLKGMKQGITTWLNSGTSNILKSTLSFGGKSLLVGGSAKAVEQVVRPHTSEDFGRLSALLAGTYVESKVFGLKKPNAKESVETVNGTSKSDEIAKNIKTSYVKSISDLKNTENFKQGALEHVLEGEINKRGKAVGFHYEGFPTTKGSIIEGTKSATNGFGVYTGEVEVNGVPKLSNGGKSTFFPENWSAQDIVEAINEAFNNKEFVKGTRNTYIGELKNGMQIEMYIDSATNKIISAFPVE